MKEITEKEQSAKEALPNLSDKYQVVAPLEAGANDLAFLIKDKDGKEYVGLTPLDKSNAGWSKTQGKYQALEKFKGIDGLDKYLVHEVEAGTLQISPDATVSPNKVLVVEYGGESVDHAQDDADKVKIMRQMLDCFTKFHQAGFVVNDNKLNHWLYQKKEGDVAVKLIDYTQISNSFPDQIKNLQHLDLRSLIASFESFFPWYRLPKETPGQYGYEASAAYLTRIVEDISQKAETL
jgi:hypothetical protein